MGSFIPKSKDYTEQIRKAFKEADDAIDKDIKKKMEDIVNVVYKTAHSKRPMITKAQMKASGRLKRVSDPGASAGVPVDTGDLQASIKKEVRQKGEKFIGRIFVDGPGAEYASYMEFGTSKILPRSFLRSAMHLNKEWIKRRFEKKE